MEVQSAHPTQDGVTGSMYVHNQYMWENPVQLTWVRVVSASLAVSEVHCVIANVRDAYHSGAQATAHLYAIQ